MISVTPAQTTEKEVSDKIINVNDLHKTFVTGFLPYGRISRVLWKVWPRGAKVLSNRVEAVKGLSFSVRRGEIFGLLGPNGAGKTTTLKIMMGLIFQDKGEIKLFGHKPGSLPAKKRTGFLPENPYFYDYLRAEEFLSLVAALTGIARNQRKKRIHEMLKRVGLEEAVDRPLRKYSKGMLQRIGLAQALLCDPLLVVLDEPLSGLDPVGRKEIRDIIRGLKKEGKTVLFSSHILSDVEMLCDRVAIMSQGSLRHIGPLDDLLKDDSGTMELVMNGKKDVLDEFLEKWDGRGERIGEKARFITKSVEEKDRLLKKALEIGLSVESLSPRRSSLEEIFMSKTGSIDEKRSGKSKSKDENGDGKVR